MTYQPPQGPGGHYPQQPGYPQYPQQGYPQQGYPPGGYAPGYYAPAYGPVRPTSVTVLSIIGIVIASLMILFGLCGVIVLSAESAGSTLFADDSGSGVQQAMQSDRTWTRYNLITTSLSLPLGVVVLASSIASLKLRAWGRTGLIAYAWIAILNTIIGLVMVFAVLLPLLQPYFNSADPAEKGGAYGGVIGGFVGALIGVIFPICILIFFRRPHVKQAFGVQGGVAS